MSYFDICPECGAHLDPGEKCDCKEKGKEVEHYYKNYIKVTPTGQLTLVFD